MPKKPRDKWRPTAKRPELTRRLPWGSLRVLVTVADCQSFTRAADMLGVTASAVSMQISSLEDYLGIKLFRRDGRLVKPTGEATLLLPRIREGLAGLHEALEEGRMSRGSGGTLYISSLPSFAIQWLMPRMMDFQSRFPRLHLRVSLSVAMDFTTNGMHAAIRFGAGNWAGVQEQFLLNEWLVPVCRPGLLKAHGPVESLEDLKRYPLIHSTGEPWSAWISGSSENYWPESGLGLDDSGAVVRLAATGAGLALARWALIGEELRTGELVLASKRITPFTRRYYFVWLPSMSHIKKITLFRDWLLEHAAAFPTPALPPGRKA
jgi:LysR family glycine cleavage system transcriptional activator